jgi:hypothetical protein
MSVLSERIRDVDAVKADLIDAYAAAELVSAPGLDQVLSCASGIAIGDIKVLLDKTAFCVPTKAEPFINITTWGNKRAKRRLSPSGSVCYFFAF